MPIRCEHLLDQQVKVFTANNLQFHEWQPFQQVFFGFRVARKAGPDQQDAIDIVGKVRRMGQLRCREGASHRSIPRRVATVTGILPPATFQRGPQQVCAALLLADTQPIHVRWAALVVGIDHADIPDARLWQRHLDPRIAAAFDVVADGERPAVGVMERQQRIEGRPMAGGEDLQDQLLSLFPSKRNTSTSIA